MLFFLCAAFSETITNGLIASYTFTGNANDSQGGNNGSPVNGTYLTSDRSGNANSAYGFDGNDDYIDCGTSTVTQFVNNNSFSISMWFKLTADDERKPLIDRYRYGIEAGADETLYFWIRTNDSGTWTSSTAKYNSPLVSGQWYHAVGVYDDQGTTQTVKLYLDGQLIESIASDPLSNTYTYSNLFIGRSSHVGGIYYNGSLDEVLIYNRALSSAEVQTIYGPVPEPASCVLFFLALFSLWLIKKGRLL